jgi:peptidoglycan hydrolase CwlO-like protein
MKDRSDKNESKWGSAFREQVLWFIFAVVLAVGTSYMQVKLSVTTVNTNLANAKERISQLEDRQDEIDNQREALRIQIEKIDQKINILLERQGVDTSKLDEANQNDE